jgi:hypothetical protein
MMVERMRMIRATMGKIQISKIGIGDSLKAAVGY